MKYPTLSIIIPTYNSERFITMCLKALKKQRYPQEKLEIIVVDNLSQDETVGIARSLGVKVFLHKGRAPQVCQQRNRGAKKSKGDYLLFLDHDMEMSKNLLKNFAENVYKTKSKIDAWYIPEKVVAGNTMLSQIRTLEKRFYDGTVINAARLIKRETYNKTTGYDEKLSGGPADWDMDNKLRLQDARFGYLEKFILHHEEDVSILSQIAKKGSYFNGIKIYQKKWQRRNKKIYNQIIRKQFSPFYRYITVFVENGKWKKLLLPNFHIFLLLLATKLLIGVTFIFRKSKINI